MRFLLLVFAIILSACDTKVIIKSTPEGANVTELVKGTLGETPTEVNFSRTLFGKADCPTEADDETCLANFYFSKQGYAPKQVSKIIEGDRMVVHVTLQTVQTKLQVSTSPDFATVTAQYQKADGNWSNLSLAGKVGNTLSLNDTAVWEARDSITVKLNVQSSGYFPKSNLITIRRGELKQLEVTLSEYAINASIESSPSGADVFEKSLGYLGRTPFNVRIPYDQLVRISPQRLIKLDSPVYLFLEVKKAGYQPTSKITSVGTINESRNQEQLNILVQLPPMQKKP